MALSVLSISPEQIDDEWAFLGDLKAIRRLIVHGQPILSIERLGA
jgi:hypothetical protein